MTDNNVTCLSLKKEFDFFDNLILDIKVQKTLFDELESLLVKKGIERKEVLNNDFLTNIQINYLCKQILDCGKFFDKDRRSFSFDFVLRHASEDVRCKFNNLHSIWNLPKLKVLRDKVFAHSDRTKQVEKLERAKFEEFLCELFKFFDQLVNDLGNEQRLISSSSTNGNETSYLEDVKEDVSAFVEMIK